MADQIVTRYGYNRFGEEVSQLDANSHETTFAYNQFGQRVQRILPGGQHEEFFYDLAGNMIIHTNFMPVDSLGRIIELSYDALGRLLRSLNADMKPHPWCSSRTMRLASG